MEHENASQLNKESIDEMKTKYEQALEKKRGKKKLLKVQLSE